MLVVRKGEKETYGTAGKRGEFERRETGGHAGRRKKLSEVGPKEKYFGSLPLNGEKKKDFYEKKKSSARAGGRKDRLKGGGRENARCANDIQFNSRRKLLDN